jgi:hypothetical protein
LMTCLFTTPTRHVLSLSTRWTPATLADSADAPLAYKNEVGLSVQSSVVAHDSPNC